MEFDRIKEIMRHNSLTEAAFKVRKAQKQPNYYAILPATIRYDKELTYLEKILYGEITALSNKHGYCYATNGWFARNFGNSERTIERSISHLRDLGYVTTTLENVGGITSRKIWLSEVKKDTDPTKMSQPTRQKCLPNNIKYNNTSNALEPMQLPDWLGKSSWARVVKVYELMFEYKFGVPHTVKASSPGSAAVKKLITDYGEIQAALIVVLHFEWKGATGDDENKLRHLLSNGFPLPWIGRDAALYTAYIKNNLGITTDSEAIDRVDDVLAEISDLEGFAAKP